MRLSPLHIERFKTYFDSLCETPHELYLFGSRVDDSKKGGDIDLLLIVSSQIVLEKLKASLAQLKIKLRDLADDQRVDLILASPESLTSDPFLKSISYKIRL